MKLFGFMLIFLFSSCDRMPDKLLELLEKYQITYSKDRAGACTLAAIQGWEQELQDKSFRKEFADYLERNQIQHFDLIDDQIGSINCDYISLTNNEEIFKTSACDPATYLLKGKQQLPPSQIEQIAGTITIQTYSLPEYKNEYVYHVAEETAENQLALAHLLVEESEAGEYLSFEKINQYSQTFPVEIMERKYHTYSNCSSNPSLSEIIAK